MKVSLKNHLVSCSSQPVLFYLGNKNKWIDSYSVMLFISLSLVYTLVLAMCVFMYACTCVDTLCVDLYIHRKEESKERGGRIVAV